MSEIAIAVRDVAKTYRGRRGVTALRGVSFEVARGEIFGLLGRNGAGKTTLVKILLDIVRPSQGSTELLGRSSRSSQARHAIGYLPEDHRFPGYQKPDGALAYYGRLSGLDEATIAQRTPELLELVGLTRARAQKVRSFSKGMKQRLGLAQAMMADPTILFLDEPTDGVDPVGRIEIRDVLFRLKEMGKTIFLNSHLLSEVEEICDRVAILELGTLRRIDSIKDITQGDGGWTVQTAAPASPEVVRALEGIVVGVREHELALEVRLQDEAEIDAVIDCLRAHGVGIRGVHRQANTLERVFIDLIQNGAAGAA